MERRARGLSDALGMCQIEKAPEKTSSKSTRNNSSEEVSTYMKSKQLVKENSESGFNSMKRTRSSMKLVRQCDNCKTLFENSHICRNKPTFAKKLRQIEQVEK